MVTHNIGIIHIYVYKYLIKNLKYFIKKLTIYLAGNIYGNSLKNTVALGMGQLLFLKRLPFKRQINKMPKQTQIIRGQFADELFECIWLFSGTGTQSVKNVSTKSYIG